MTSNAPLPKSIWLCPECLETNAAPEQPWTCKGPIGSGEHRPPIPAVRYVLAEPTAEMVERAITEVERVDALPESAMLDERHAGETPEQYVMRRVLSAAFSTSRVPGDAA